MYYTLLNNKFVPCGTEPQGSPYVSLSSVSAPLAPELEKYLSFPDFQIVLIYHRTCQTLVSKS